MHEETVFILRTAGPVKTWRQWFTVFDRVGQSLYTATYSVPESDYQVDLPAWDGTSATRIKLSPGLYLVKLSVRSLVDGSKMSSITKVIISN